MPTFQNEKDDQSACLRFCQCCVWGAKDAEEGGEWEEQSK